MRTEALRKAQTKFNKKVYKYQVKMNPEVYPQEIVYLESKENKNQFLIGLVQKEMRHEQNQNPDEGTPEGVDRTNQEGEESTDSRET